MSQKTILKNTDYTKYYLDFPKKDFQIIFFKKKLHHFVRSELEKIHPFFGSHCMFDTSLLIKNKKLCIRAIVMDIGFISQYEKDNRQGKLYIKTSNDNRFIRIKEIGINNVSKVRQILLASALITILFCGCMFIVQSNQTPTVSIVIPEKITETTLEKNSMDVLYSHISEWLDLNTMCTTFSYSSRINNYDTSTYIADFEISFIGLLPEDIISVFENSKDVGSSAVLKNGLKIHPVTFKDNIPHLTLSLSTHIPVINDFNIENKSTAHSSIRKIVLNYEGTIQEENWEKRSISFSIPIMQWEMFFLNLKESMKISEQEFESFSFQCDKNATYTDCIIMLSDRKLGVEIPSLETIFEAQRVAFIDQEKQLAFSAGQTALKHASVYERVKIGGVKKSDGSEMSFYLTQEGNIVVKEEK